MKAVVYTRISQDRNGDGAGVTRQEADARALAKMRGWTVTSVIVENDTSAAGKKIRPGFERLLASRGGRLGECCDRVGAGSAHPQPARHGATHRSLPAARRHDRFGARLRHGYVDAQRSDGCRHPRLGRPVRKSSRSQTGRRERTGRPRSRADGSQAADRSDTQPTA